MLDLKEKLVCQVLQVLRDMLALKVPKDRKEVKVIMEWMGRQVSGVARAQLAPEVSQDLQALDKKVTEVHLEILEFPDLWDQSDQRVHLEFLGFLGHQVTQVSRVSVARQGYLALKVIEGFLEFKDLKVNLVMLVSEALKVILVYQVCKGWQERKDPEGHRDWLELMVKKDPEVTQDLLGHLDLEVLLGLQGMLDFQEHLGFKDHQELQAIQDDLALKVKQDHQEESSMQLAPLLLAFRDHLGLLVLLAQLDLQDYQVPLALLVCLAQLVLKVTEDLRESREKQEYQ